MVRSLYLLVVTAAFLGGCGKAGMAGGSTSEAGEPSRPAVAPTLLISPEDVWTVQENDLASGPSITGSVQPERRADLRAEVSAVVLQVLKENGDPVRRGDLLVRLDDTAIRDNLTSAEASTRAASQAHEQAERQFQRLAKLRETGVVSAQAVEDVEIRRNSAQSDLEAAKTRAAAARQQLQRTEVRAPFDGIVSDRKVSAGDTVQIGKELVKVMDPLSMRFEGMVSADSIGLIRDGQAVSFRVHGYSDQEFAGRIARVNPAANATTRQVEVLVDFMVAKEQPRLAGLYAEGRVETGSTTGLTVPATVLVKEGDRTVVWRLNGNALQKTTVVMGDRDPRSGEVMLKDGLAEGDRVVRYPGSALRDGQAIDIVSAATSSAAPVAPPPLAGSGGR